MRSIAVMNQKGGVGKTTTSVNLAAALSRAGERVMVIDLDPQAHASLHLGVALEDDDASIYDVLTAGAPLLSVRRQIDERLSLIPAHINLAAAEMELAGEVGREAILRNRLAADELALDYVIIDCAPSLGLLTLNALAAVDEVFLPLQPHFLAMHGMSKLLSTIDAVAARINPRLRLSGVVLCMYETGTRLAGEVAREVESFLAQTRGRPGCPWADARLMQTRIRRNIRLAEAPSHGRSIFDYDARSSGAEDYLALAEEVHTARAQQEQWDAPVARPHAA